MSTSDTDAIPSDASQDKPASLFLIDGSNAAFRAFYAIQSDMRAPDGMPTRALFGMTRMLLKLIKEQQPDYIAVVFDKGLSFRNALYPDYKGQRPDMPEDLRAQWGELPGLCEELGVTAVLREGHEADDIIGTLAVKHAAEDLHVVIVSSDKDFAQLVTDRVQMLDTGKNRLYGPAEVREKWGVDPDRIIDLLALMGDSSDNIPGVPGVGPKKAAKFLGKYGTLDDVLANADDIGGKTGQKVAAAHDAVQLARVLVTIKTDFDPHIWDLDHDLQTLARRPFDAPALAARLRRYNFKSLVRELGLEGEAAPPGAEDGAAPGTPGDGAGPDVGPLPSIDRDRYRTVVSADDLDWLVAQLRAAGRFAYDSETTSLDPSQATLVGMSFCWQDDMAVYVPIAHEAGGNCEGALDALLPLLADPTLKKTGQNLKYDLEVLASLGHDLLGIDGDSMLADYLLDVDRKHGLDDLALRHLGHEMLHFKDVAGPYDDRFAAVPVAEATAYAAEDAHVAWLLDRMLGAELGDPGERGPAAVYRDIELPLVPVLAGMELAGIGVDVDALAHLSDELGARIDDLVTQVQTEAGQEFNLNSTQQLARILFEERGHKPVKKTAKRTGYSTDSATLEALRRSGDPLPGLILDYRELAKLKSTYVDALPRAVGPDGRIHTSFHQAVAATGRLSSNDPNLQNIPVRTDEGRRIRRAFVARPGHVFLSADYSQVELRVLAHFCGEGALVDAFRQGQDIHRRTASEIFGVAMPLVSGEQRRAAKAINFGIVYGMSAFRLARELEIGRGEAKAYMDGYFARYPQVQRYMEQAVQDGTSRGYAETLFGRRRPLRGLDSRNFNVRSGAERIAINTPVQGSAADLIKLAMIRVDERLRRQHPDATLLLQVHDELLVEVPDAQADAVGRALVEEMEGVAELAVPLVVDLGVGKSWDEAH